MAAPYKRQPWACRQSPRWPSQHPQARLGVKKRRAQICNQIQRFIKIPTELRRQTRTSTAHTKHKRSACSRKPNYTKALLCQENCFTLDSHMLTSDSFFSLQTQHDQSQGNTNTTNKENKRTKKENVFPLSVCLMSS